ncbi:MAG: [FeFe] hydrogenase H-cluster maturation GTPase HydF [Clostridia bacterium]|nr:[FeFe] hydrogenase H-cluster maturation GTPase HydF [Clostridia bacterium]
MSLNSVSSAERVHIGFFGMRNAGKSSLVNAVTGQNVAIVSDFAGTTTDPVKKSMELLPLGPVVIIDTPGLDDEGELGAMRVKRAKRELNHTDVAVVVVDAAAGERDQVRQLIEIIGQKEIPCVVVYNNCDLAKAPAGQLCVSAKTGEGIAQLKERIAQLAAPRVNSKRVVADLIERGDFVVLVTPIDESAPKGRLILPQQQTIRDILDAGAVAVVTQPEELPQTLSSLGKKPKLVITDSQAFGRVSKMVPADITLTSFSILFVRYKGDLSLAARGAAQLDRLQDGDRVLISEGCTHHRQCGDIGTVKLPALIKKHTGGKEIKIDFTSGGDFPEDVSVYKLIIHCGGCMLSEREMLYRTRCAVDAGVPMTNYGVAIAHMNGILRRSLAPFPSAMSELDK